MTIDVSAEETLTSEHEQIIRSTLTSLQASFSSDIRAEVKLKVRGSWTSAEVVVTADGMTVRSEMRASDALLAVDGAVAQLLLQLAKYKNVAAQAIDPSKLVVREKHFPVVKMHVNQVVTEMELSGHDFFLYQDSLTGGVKLLYRRADGKYGLLVPHIAGALGEEIL